ncbi:MAG: choice-of-anchor D domain-containing protein [Candidatus Cloacimonetes bacterium]|nr:choice-of-anchor D domain-containing protein [Candidatus Cloacimonadota bacterium]
MKKFLLLLIFVFAASMAFSDQYDYLPADSPDPGSYDSNTYTELGWTEIVVTQTDNVTDVVVDYTWGTDNYASEGSFWLESPLGTSVEIASGEFSGTYNHTISDFSNESMNGTWILWIEDSWGDGGHQATGITVEFHYVLAGAPGAPTNPSPADNATDIALSGDLTWDFGADTDTYDLWFGPAGAMVEVVSGVAAGATGSYTYSGLSFDTEYEWQVISVNSARATYSGPVWSFTTMLDPAIVQIGAGTATNEHLPIEPFYGYSYSQTIYLASDFGTIPADKRIEKIWYNYSWGGGDADSDDWTIYMGTTSDNALLDWIPVAELDQVFSGDVDLELVSGDGWLEITLNNPFAYDPATDGNLVVAVDENASSYTSSSDEFYCDQDTRAYVSYHYFSDSTNPDPAAPPAGTESTYYPNTRFEFQDIPAIPVFAVNPTSFDFGTVNLGDTSVEQTFTISNLGGGTLTVTDVAFTGTDADQFVLTDGNTYPHDLGASESITVDVAFAPTSEGAKTANLTITDGRFSDRSATKASRAATDVPLTGDGREANYGGGGAAQGNYFFANSEAGGAPSHPTYNWINYASHTEITTWTSGSADDGYFEVPDIGFDFTFFGNVYRTADVYIGTNGLITFGTGFSSTGSSASIPDADTPNNMIAGCLMDLDNDTGTPNGAIYYGGDATQFVVTYYHYYDYFDASEWMTFQIILYPNGNIKIQYNEAESTIDAAVNSSTVRGDACIGIENLAGDAGIQYRNDGDGGPIFGSDLAVAFGLNDSSLPVTLTNFTAAYFQNEFVSVTWTTESETAMNCYNLYRSETGPNEQLLINTQYALNSTSTHSYEYQDHEVENGVTYSYWLEAVAYDGSSTEYGPTSVTILGEETPELPDTTLLYGNYPNPFNPVTNIKFDIKEGETAQLTIYSVRGRVVARETFTANDENTGRITYNWDASKNASGVYFYRLSSESYTEVKKMLLLK